MLVGPPRMLGTLRGHLDADTARCVVASIAREWTELRPEKLRARCMTR